MKTVEELANEHDDRIERQAILCVSLLAMNDGEYFAAKKAYKAGYQAAMNDNLPQVTDMCSLIDSMIEAEKRVAEIRAKVKSDGK